MKPMVKAMILTAIFLVSGACTTVHNPSVDTAAIPRENGDAAYPVKEVLYSTEKGLTIGLANVKNETDIEANKQKILKVIDQLKPYGVDMIVFPEFSLTGYFWNDEGQEDSDACWKYMNEGVLNRHMAWLKTAVKPRLDDRLSFIIFNAIRENPATASDPGSKKKFLNSTYVIDATFDCDDLTANEKARIYDKTFLPGIEKVYSTTPKRDFLVLDNTAAAGTAWEKIGFTTCYDMCFAQIYQEYAVVHGVQALFELASWRATGSGQYGKRTYDLKCKACEACDWVPCPVTDQNYYGFQWDLMAADRAATNQVWMIAANAVGFQEKGGYQFWGGSGVWAPSGMKIVEASHDTEELVIVRNLQITEGIQSEQEKFSYDDDFKKVYKTVPGQSCGASGCCSQENCCGAFSRFE